MSQFIMCGCCELLQNCDKDGWTTQQSRETETEEDAM